MRRRESGMGMECYCSLIEGLGTAVNLICSVMHQSNLQEQHSSSTVNTALPSLIMLPVKWQSCQSQRGSLQSGDLICLFVWCLAALSAYRLYHAIGI